MKQEKTVILVGHCGPDQSLLSTAVKRMVPGVEIKLANDRTTMQELTRPESVLLINRIPDGEFGGESGVELIREIADTNNPPVTILISNFDDAQKEAVNAGAAQGFGKSNLYDEQTESILREAMGMGSVSTSE